MRRSLFLGGLLLAASLLTACGGNLAASQDNAPRAAIIDQLYLLKPEQEFVTRTTEVLESQGFVVDLWQGQEITVDFYRSLPDYGYKFIIFRTHSGTLLGVEGSQLVPSETTYLFSGETYATNKHVAEQLTDRVSNALMTEDYPPVFAVNSEFVAKEMNGEFDDTVILMMGCESLQNDDMAAAFVQKGASVYLGWSTVVSLQYVDRTTLELVRNLYTENLTVERGVGRTMKNEGIDPYFHAYLKYYPQESGRQTLNELIR